MRRTRLAIVFFFLGDGLVLGSWAARIPAVQRHADLSNRQLGLALFAASLGALISMPITGRLCERVGSRSVTVFALLLAATSLTITSLATGLGELAAALFGFGAGFGSINVAANAQGIALERRYGRSILSSFHAAFSAGGLAGAGLGALAAAGGISPRTHFAVVTLALAVGSAALARLLLAPEEGAAPSGRVLVRPTRPLLIIGAAAFCTMMAEGAAADWSSVYLDRSLGAAAGVAALGYTAFSLAMAASRLLGDRLNAHVGPVALVRGGGAFAAAGLGIALAVGSVPVGLAGFAAMGAGLGVVVPVLFRAAGAAAGVSASVGVAAASTIGWFGFLAGPPAIGFAAGAVGLRAALGIVVLATLALAVLAGKTQPARLARTPDGHPRAPRTLTT